MATQQPAPKGFFRVADVIVASALTPLHVGAGRSPGVVDLPVIRDPFGFPYVPGSALKGSLKSTLAQRLCDLGTCIDNRGFIKCEGNDCSQCKDLCCLLGPEPGEGDKGAAALAFTELLPVILPVPSLEHGYIYATSPYLAARGLAVLEAVVDVASSEKEAIDALHELLKAVVEEFSSGSKEAQTKEPGTVTVGLESYEVKPLDVNSIDMGELQEVLSRLNPMYSARPLARWLYVFSDSDMPSVVEKALYRVTRVALRRDTKTVSSSALWTEEYLPPGTLFLGLVVYNAGRNKYCDKKGANEIRKLFYDKLGEIGGKDSLVVIIGGKETIGKGLLRASLLHATKTSGEVEKA